MRHRPKERKREPITVHPCYHSSPLSTSTAYTRTPPSLDIGSCQGHHRPIAARTQEPEEPVLVAEPITPSGRKWSEVHTCLSHRESAKTVSADLVARGPPLPTLGHAANEVRNAAIKTASISKAPRGKQRPEVDSGPYDLFARLSLRMKNSGVVQLQITGVYSPQPQTTRP